MKKNVYLVVYSHRFGNDYYIFTTKKKAQAAMKELKTSEEYDIQQDLVDVEILDLQ